MSNYCPRCNTLLFDADIFCPTCAVVQSHRTRFARLARPAGLTFYQKAECVIVGAGVACLIALGWMMMQ